MVANADGLSDRRIQQIVREFNNSRTAFMFSSDGDTYDEHIHFFTPTEEVPIYRHATFAAHYVRAVSSSWEQHV